MGVKDRFRLCLVLLGLLAPVVVIRQLVLVFFFRASFRATRASCLPALPSARSFNNLSFSSLAFAGVIESLLFKSHCSPRFRRRSADSHFSTLASAACLSKYSVCTFAFSNHPVLTGLERSSSSVGGAGFNFFVGGMSARVSATDVRSALFEGFLGLMARRLPFLAGDA